MQQTLTGTCIASAEYAAFSKSKQLCYFTTAGYIHTVCPLPVSLYPVHSICNLILRMLNDFGFN